MLHGFVPSICVYHSRCSTPSTSRKRTRNTSSARYFLPFFCMTNPQINYYNLRLLLVLWHGAHLRRPEHQVGLAWLLALEMVVQWTKVVEWDRYTTTTTTSMGLLVYMLGLVVWMVYRSVEGESESSAESTMAA